LRQSSSAGAHIDLSSVRFQCDMTKITRTDANQCSSGVSMAFSSRPGVPLLITKSKKEFDIMTAMKCVK
ncbi:hypothetical protein T07_7604, partial [Trichinella nelsoni]